MADPSNAASVKLTLEYQSFLAGLQSAAGGARTFAQTMTAGFKQVAEETKTTRNVVVSVMDAIGKDTERALNGVRSDVSKVVQVLEDWKREERELAAEAKRTAEEHAQAEQKRRQSIEATRKKAREERDAMRQLAADQKKAADEATASAEKHAKALGAVRNILIGLGTAIETYFGIAVKKSMDFENQMNRVQKVMRLPQDQYKAMSEQVRTMPFTLGTAQSSESRTNALRQIGEAGYRGAEGVTVLTAAVRAADRGMASTEEATTPLVRILKAYNLGAGDAARVSDLMVDAAHKGGVEFPKMASAIGRLAVVAKQSGVSIEELFGSLTVMTPKLGVAGAERALNGLIKSLETIGARPKAAQAMQTLGIAIDGNTLRSKGLLATIEMIDAKAYGSMTLYKKLLSGGGGAGGAGIEAMSALGGKTNEARQIGAGQGQNPQVAAEQSKSLSKQIANLWERLYATMAKMGEMLAPYIAKIIGWLGDLTTWFENLSPVAQKWIVVAAAVGAGVSVMAGAFIAAAPAITAIAAVGAETLGAVAAWTAGIGAAVAGLAVVWYQNWGGIQEKAFATWDALKAGALYLYENIPAIWAQTWATIQSTFDAAWAEIGPGVTEFWNFLKEEFAAILPAVQDAMSVLGPMIVGGFQVLWEDVKTATTIAVEALKAAWYILKDVVAAVWPVIANTVRVAVDVIAGLVSTVSKIIHGDWSGAWESFGTMCANGVNHVLGILEGLGNAIISIFSKILPRLVSAGANIIYAIAKGIKSAGGAVRDAIVHAVAGTGGATVEANAGTAFSPAANAQTQATPQQVAAAKDTWSWLKGLYTNAGPKAKTGGVQPTASLSDADRAKQASLAEAKVAEAEGAKKREADRKRAASDYVAGVNRDLKEALAGATDHTERKKLISESLKKLQSYKDQNVEPIIKAESALRTQYTREETKQRAEELKKAAAEAAKIESQITTNFVNEQNRRLSEMRKSSGLKSDELVKFLEAQRKEAQDKLNTLRARGTAETSPAVQRLQSFIGGRDSDIIIAKENQKKAADDIRSHILNAKKQQASAEITMLQEQLKEGKDVAGKLAAAFRARTNDELAAIDEKNRKEMLGLADTEENRRMMQQKTGLEKGAILDAELTKVRSILAEQQKSEDARISAANALIGASPIRTHEQRQAINAAFAPAGQIGVGGGMGGFALPDIGFSRGKFDWEKDQKMALGGTRTRFDWEGGPKENLTPMQSLEKAMSAQRDAITGEGGLIGALNNLTNALTGGTGKANEAGANVAPFAGASAAAAGAAAGAAVGGGTYVDNRSKTTTNNSTTNNSTSNTTLNNKTAPPRAANLMNEINDTLAKWHTDFNPGGLSRIG